MISKEKYQFVQKAIQTYSPLKDKSYFILYKSSIKVPAKYLEISILEENFWHLTGCKIDDHFRLTPVQKHNIYKDCEEGKDVSKYLNYTRQPQDVIKKANVVMGVFNFIKNAKSMRVCDTTGAPEAVMLEYVISPKALFSLQQELPLSLRYESNLFSIKNPPISDISKTGGQ